MKVLSNWRSVRLWETQVERDLHRHHSLRTHGILIGQLGLAPLQHQGDLLDQQFLGGMVQRQVVAGQLQQPAAVVRVVRGDGARPRRRARSGRKRRSAAGRALQCST